MNNTAQPQNPRQNARRQFDKFVDGDIFRIPFYFHVFMCMRCVCVCRCLSYRMPDLYLRHLMFQAVFGVATATSRFVHEPAASGCVLHAAAEQRESIRQRNSFQIIFFPFVHFFRPEMDTAN